MTVQKYVAQKLNVTTPIEFVIHYRTRYFFVKESSPISSTALSYLQKANFEGSVIVSGVERCFCSIPQEACIFFLDFEEKKA